MSKGGYMKYLFIQDRESERWYCCGLVPFQTDYEYTNSGRKKKKLVQKDYVYPRPEDVSAFVKAHKIIEAEKEGEAWAQLN